MTIAVFDVDHTITRVSTGRRLIVYGWRAGLFSLPTVLSLPYHYLRYRNGSLNMDRITAKIAGLAGRTHNELTDLAERCFAEVTRRDIMPDAAARVHQHQTAGHMVVLATSSLDLIVQPLARELGIDHVISTELEFVNGVATGAFARPPCFSEEKKRRVTEYVRDAGHELRNVMFYSDSRLDLPLLQAAGTAVAVNPDGGLLRHARVNSWPVLRFN